MRFLLYSNIYVVWTSQECAHSVEIRALRYTD